MLAALLLSLVPRLHHAYTREIPSRIRPRVEAIATVTTNPVEARELLAIDFIETTFRARDSRGRVLTPFGEFELDRNHPGRHTLVDYARGALATLQMATRECGPNLVARMHFYRVGRCQHPDAEARRRARIVRRIRNSVPAQLATIR